MSTGSHDASARSPASGCPDPCQRPAPTLCATRLPSRRRGHARPQTAHRASGGVADQPGDTPPGWRLECPARHSRRPWRYRPARERRGRGARYLFRPAAVAIQILLALTGLAAVLAAATAPQHFVLRVRPAQIPLVIGLSLAAVAVHELAHALVVIRHGHAVDAAGVRLHLGTPACYVESASAVLLTRRQRLVQAAAGVWAEWQFTSLIAIWLWLTPLPLAVPLLHRFVILNAATIATNLLPFTGLDGSWLLADTTGVPDLTRRSHGAITRLLTHLTTRNPLTPADRALAAYSAANGLAATALLATAGFFWYQLFGDLAATLTHHGPAGWALLIAAAILLGRPAATAAAARLPAAARTARDLRDAITFRLQWWWRIPATRHLAGVLHALAGLNAAQLSILSGHLQRTRHRGALPAALTSSYGIVAAGTITASTLAGPRTTLTPGETWGPHHRLRHATRHATLIYIDATTLHQLLATNPAGQQAPAGNKASGNSGDSTPESAWH